MLLASLAAVSVVSNVIIHVDPRIQLDTPPTLAASVGDRIIFEFPDTDSKPFSPIAIPCAAYSLDGSDIVPRVDSWTHYSIDIHDERPMWVYCDMKDSLNILALINPPSWSITDDPSTQPIILARDQPQQHIYTLDAGR